MAFPKAHRTVLKNGLRVVVVPMPGNPTVTVSVLVEVGSHYEDKKVNGLSHFLEHMCFKGTPTRPTALSISHELDALGATSNAFTGNEATGYWAKSRAKYFSQIFDVVADIYLHPLLPEAELEKERGVIIEEINMYDDRPQDVVHDALDVLMYGDQPAGRPIIGPKENIRRFTRNDFVQYRERYYVPERTVVVIAGGVTVSQATTLAKKYFLSMPKRVAPKKPRVHESQKQPQVRVVQKDTKQTHLVIGFRAFDTYDKRLSALKVLSTVLGRGMSSRLFQKLREELGVCYYARSGYGAFADFGTFKVTAGVDSNRLYEVIPVILEELRRLTKELVPQKEFDKAKELIVGHAEMSLESSDDFADFYGEREIDRKPLETPEQFLKKIKAVTREQVRAVAKTLFKNAGMNLAVIGDGHDEKRLKKLLSL